MAVAGHGWLFHAQSLSAGFSPLAGWRSRLRGLLRFPGFPQGAEAVHVLANGNGIAFDLRYRSRAVLHIKAPPVGARDAFRGGFGRFLFGHLPNLSKREPA